MRMPDLEMPAETKKEWLAALRSGEYQQATCALETDKGYCCLGVLQMVVDGKVERSRLDEKLSAAEPTDEWYEENEMESFSKVTKTGGRAHNFLIQMNDEGTYNEAEGRDEPLTFLHIADWIEENVEGV